MTVKNKNLIKKLMTSKSKRREYVQKNMMYPYGLNQILLVILEKVEIKSNYLQKDLDSFNFFTYKLAMLLYNMNNFYAINLRRHPFLGNFLLYYFNNINQEIEKRKTLL